MTTPRTYLKFLDKNCHGPLTGFVYPLPVNGQPGEWTPYIEDPQPGIRGYHLLDKHGPLFPHLDNTAWEIEPKDQEFVATQGYGIRVSHQVRLVRQLPWNQENCATILKQFLQVAYELNKRIQERTTLRLTKGYSQTYNKACAKAVWLYSHNPATLASMAERLKFDCIQNELQYIMKSWAKENPLLPTMGYDSMNSRYANFYDPSYEKRGQDYFMSVVYHLNHKAIDYWEDFDWRKTLEDVRYLFKNMFRCFRYYVTELGGILPADDLLLHQWQYAMSLALRVLDVNLPGIFWSVIFGTPGPGVTL